tara:strand:- start:18 stop:227 length:210 start_codon:yes stop_codon:yes gene_type:complete
MKANMGNLDRIIRSLVAVVILVLYFTGQLTGLAAIILLVIAGAFLLTSFMKVCPLYLPFGISSKPRKAQ